MGSGSRPTLSCLAARRAAKKAAKPSKTQGHIIQRSGEEFRSKKAQGDVKRNSKVEPFAYIRLNRTMLREKHRPQALQVMWNQRVLLHAPRPWGFGYFRIDPPAFQAY